MKVLVKTTWLEACGKSEFAGQWMTAEIDQTNCFSNLGNCYNVTLPDGQNWVLFQCRIEEIEEIEAVEEIEEIEEIEAVEEIEEIENQIERPNKKWAGEMKYRIRFILIDILALCIIAALAISTLFFGV